MGSTVVPLESLASHYVAAYHETYLRRLNEVIKDSRNRNIALTGRYGTGKSSILDRFEEEHKDATTRLAISTLGPEGDGASDSKTNRIQKELVKQLIYSSSPKTLRGSAFSRSEPLPLGRAVGEAAGIVVLVGVLLALLGWLPELAGAGQGEPAVQRGALWGVFAAVVVVIVTGLRLLLHGRVISDVSAAGAQVSLSERPHTYFDKYLEGIVNFFDEESPDYVVFEDLDRFGDPHIFEALRELNTLLNDTPRRLEKGRPLRFIYAVKDSLFERLGSDTEAEGDDAATAETVRANRTKFFDVVIPVVPFISHRNARDLLRTVLAEAMITKIDRSLVDLVAQHTTDMRLLVNMRNEYLIFAERLLEAAKQAPGLTPTGLFALVAYKNFHLKDFEDISRRGSDLDLLYRYRRELVRSGVAQAERKKRELLRGRARSHAKADLASELGGRLVAVAEAIRLRSGHNSPSYVLRFVVGSKAFQADQVTAPSFWAAVVDVGQIEVYATANPAHNGQSLLTLQRAHLDALCPEALGAEHWAEIDEDQLRSAVAQLDADVAFLRGADFGALAGADTFTLAVDRPASEGTDGERSFVSFGQLIDETMKSDLARELVMRGYLDRNFALYAAQFYGDFTGIDVATFVVQSVQTNTMEIDYRFTSPGAVENLLSEVGDDFTRTVSAYNITVVDYLLGKREDLAENVVNRMVSSFDGEAREFLTAYVASGTRRAELVTRLSAHGWRDVFTYLVTSEDVPEDARVTLVDAGIAGAAAGQTYDLGSEVSSYIEAHSQAMPGFTTAQDDARAQTTASLLDGANVRVSNLASVHSSIRTHLVGKSLYQLTAPNLRAALDTTSPVSVDHILACDVVYAYCLANPARYLDAVDSDQATRYSVESADALRTILTDVAGVWSTSQVDTLISRAAPESILDDLVDVPVPTWAAIARNRLVRTSVSNVKAYVASVGGVDEPLAHLLVDAGAIDVDGDQSDDSTLHADKLAVAVAILNARSAIPNPRDRVGLVGSLDLGVWVPADRLQPEPGEFLSILIAERVVADEAAAFQRFHPAGWSAFEPAILSSDKFGDFVSPELLDGMVAQVFGSEPVRRKIGRVVVARLGELVRDSDVGGLTAAGSYAVEQGIGLPIDQVRRVASAGIAARDVTLRLLQISRQAPPDIVSALTELGVPYSNLSTGVEREFEVPYDEAHRAVFGQLASAGLCTATKKRNQDRLTVRVL